MMRLPGFTAGAALYASGRSYYMAGPRRIAVGQGVVPSQDCPNPCPTLNSQMCPIPYCDKCTPPGWETMTAQQQCAFAYNQCAIVYHDPSDPTDCCHWWNSQCLTTSSGGGGDSGGGEPHGPPFHHGRVAQ
jgi:hypothetical protein